MPRVKFDQISPDARLWIFAAERRLSKAESVAILEKVDVFIEQWAAHDVPLISASELRYEQFIFIAVYEGNTGASGCSIDALVRRMKELQAEFEVELVNHSPVLYRHGGGISRVSRERFTALVEAGEVAQETVVFDNTVTSVSAVRDGRWELPAVDSWHGAAFF